MKPLLPKHATVHSAISAWARCGQVNVRAPEHRGNQASLLAYDYALAAHAHRLSERVFKGAISAADIVDFHSHVPMYGSFMTALQALGWRERLITGVPARDTIAMGIRRHSVVEAQTLRKCPTCVRDDRERFGCAHWRLFHQWPVARHCVVHGDALMTHCADCKTPFTRGNRPLLADDACVNCGGSRSAGEPFEAPPGYWPLMKLLFRALRVQAPELSALVRAQPLLRSTTPACGWVRVDPRERVQLERLLSSWAVGSVAELAAMMGTDWFGGTDSHSAEHDEVAPNVMRVAVAACLCNAGVTTVGV